MKKKDVVKSNILFNDIIKDGQHIANKYFVVCISKSVNSSPLFGIAVGKKVGNAVTRNKIKRQIRNIIDQNRDVFSNFHNYVVICKKEILNISFEEKNTQLVKLIAKGENHEK